ncbi:hypothetical protein ABIE30_001053 [Janthinobacterium lividum]|uniref:heparin lyase I family protein n=1 Tax=Janthinobacterium lividum TaxID=29581 RepID=UPI003D1ED915
MRSSIATAMLALLAATPLHAQVVNSIGGPVTTMAPTSLPRPASFDNVTTRYFSWLYGISAGNPAGVELVGDPAVTQGVETRKVFRMTVNASDSDEYGKRTEVTPSYERMPQGRRWYAGGVYFPADWDLTGKDGWIVVFQVHSARGIVVTSPPFSIIADGPDLVLETRANHRDTYTLKDGVMVPDATANNTVQQRLVLGKIEREKWYCVVLDADWQHASGTGASRLWLNGKLVYEGSNFPTHYMNVDLPSRGNYPKTGAYLGGFQDTLHGKRVLYTDFIHLGGAASTYAQMAAQTPCPAPPAT